MQKQKSFLTVRMLVRCALVAALYTVLCLAFAPLSYGAVQIRFAEALTLMPIFGAEYILAVTLGCFLSNLLGSTLVDVVFGTIATGLACALTYLVRHKRFKGLALAAALPPIAFNAVIVGCIELSFFLGGGAVTLPMVLWNGFTVGLGEVISCGVLGVLLVKLIEQNAGLKRLFAE